jgi:excinuclease ABC A subunit
LHNLEDLSVGIPLGRFVCITGVAGSGKTTLISEFFVKQHPMAVVVDQAPVGRSSRSNPATYCGAFTPIRELFGRSNDIDPAHFSFNSAGACRECKGMGVLEVEMRFLDPVRMTCPTCKGNRFNTTVLHFRMGGKNIAEVLEMTVSNALDFFSGLGRHQEIHKSLWPLVQVGLGYLSLGQPLSTVSGGEAQRLKLARELKRRDRTFVLDEPTTGLHIADIDILVAVFHQLVDRHNSVIVIEHNLDVIRQADWVIDMGPGAGKDGGRIIAEGTPEQIAANPDSVTGHYLKNIL